jgi:hypothetical protein
MLQKVPSKTKRHEIRLFPPKALKELVCDKLWFWENRWGKKKREKKKKSKKNLRLSR